MDKQIVWVVVALLAIWFLFIRKKSALIIGATSTSTLLPTTPKAAIPNPSTAQVLSAAAINNAPQILKAVGSFFDSDNDVDTSDDDSSDD
jgi:hypothetical protein